MVTLKCPLVPTECMNNLSEQLGSLPAADAEIRALAESRSTPTPYCCNGAIGCQCKLCSDVRDDFRGLLNRLLSNTANAPPPPTELPPLPPSTLPPRMPTNPCAKPIAKKPMTLTVPIPEDVPVNFCFRPNDPSRTIDGTDVVPRAPFRAIDLPLLAQPMLQLEDGSIAGSETPSELVSHISWDRVSTAVSRTESDWHVTSARSNAGVRTEWMFDSTDLAEPSRREVCLPIPPNATLFDIASQRSESSWAPIEVFKFHSDAIPHREP